MENKNKLHNIEVLRKEVSEIVETINVKSASLLLKEIFSMSQGERDSLGRELKELLVKLMIVNFPGISDSDATEIIKNHLIAFFKTDVPFEQRLIARYEFQGTTEKNKQRGIIKKAILENQEKIGDSTIGVWMKKFDQRYGEEWNEQNVVNFFLEDKKAMLLSEADKGILKSILHTYGTLIASEIVDIFDIAIALKKIDRDAKGKSFDTSPTYQPQRSQFQYSQSTSQSSKKPTESIEAEDVEMIAIQEAISKFPKVRDQLISSQRIFLGKDTSRPVVPSIKNWIADYTYNIGYGDHSSIQRSDYLFKGRNAKNLTQPEKEKISFVLKAFDEKKPLKVNKREQVIVFPEKSPQQSPQPKAIPSQEKQSAINKKEEVKNVQKEQFDFRQKMPFEKNLPPFRITPDFTRKKDLPNNENANQNKEKKIQKIPQNKQNHASQGQPS